MLALEPKAWYTLGKLYIQAPSTQLQRPAVVDRILLLVHMEGIGVRERVSDVKNIN